MILIRGIKLHPVLLLIILHQQLISVPVHGYYNCTKPQLEVTVMPLKKDLYVHWDIERIQEGDWIGLYEKMFVKEVPTEYMIGYHLITANRGMAPMKRKYNYDGTIDMRQLCLGYWAVYWRVDKTAKRQPFQEIVVSTCLKNHPTWMEHYWHIIKDQPMNRLLIPGTHDSASYEGLSHNPFKKMTKWLKTTAILTFIKHCKQEIVPLVNLYALTQDQNIYDQLMFGIRYLDIRVYRSDHFYWACHGAFLMVNLQKVIEDVIEFVQQTKKEIIIFDIHQLNKSGFKNRLDHEIFIFWLKRKFTYNGKPLWIDYYPKNNWGKTVGELAKAGGRIIITYSDEYHQLKYSNTLWPNVYHYWGNKQSPKTLIRYLRDTVSPINDVAYAAMAELTMNAKHLCLNLLLNIHRHPGLREKANQIAPLIYDLFWDYSMARRTNIIAVDFARSMGVVRAALVWNERFALNRASHERKYCDPVNSYLDDYYQSNSLPLEYL